MEVNGGRGGVSPKVTKWRNILAFWVFGLTNNYPYVVMLSGALDIIHNLESNNSNTPSNSTHSDVYNDSCSLFFNESSNSSSYEPRSLCQRQGTAVILLADILPTFIVKLTAPYWMHFVPYWIRVLSVIAFSTASFLIIALSTVEAIVLFGVVCASLSSGFGETTFLSLTSRYDKSTVSSWSSGTGAAGVAGALLYAGFRAFLSVKVTLLIQIFIPALMLLTYFLLLGPKTDPTSNSIPASSTPETSVGENDVSSLHLEKKDDDTPLLVSGQHKRRWFDVELWNKEEAKYWLSHVKYIPHLFKYMVPLFLVYFAEYTINQSFFELLYSPNTHLGSFCMDQRTQYRWLQVVYQVGVFISRSSVSFIYIKHFWILSLLQLGNFVLFFCASIYLFLPSFWLTVLLVLYEGLLGGGVYVNAFYTITKQVPKIHLEFSMSVASVADSTGIVAAAVAGLFIHQYICKHFIGYLP